MLKVLLAIVTGLVGAALLHLIIILALPSFSERDAYSKVLGEGQPFRFHALGGRKDATGLAKEDPFLEVAVCAFDLTEAPVRLSAGSGVPFWSLATFDAASNETFSINDRTSAGGMLDVIVATPVQATALRKAMPSSLMQSIIVETAEPQGYAVLRVLSPQRSFRPMATQFLAEADCGQMAWQ
ncbi:DUF1254 domain-containing protein [Rhizobium sp. SL86]|jgi:uncharacterized membrane protein|uniref:DUF1254 domain-containing protein n=1 Tax=Rhizobium sp. SL86 TaxID=2995148 RepID=UPI002272E78D|nr:DUF1254 domain-containing protein [Rhizobium sp. SL86]MCY1664202.1 DUF1254 domain-containing protein [Rhizobium sp. SL86]